MSVYLFTYHAYGSWMPDRSRGYVRRDDGVVVRDGHMDRLYREAMKGDAVRFASPQQQSIVEAVCVSQLPQRFCAYYVATDDSHVHLLLSWTDDRGAVKMRGLVKGSLTRALNRQFVRMPWFGEGGSRKRVRDRCHFDYLMNTYLPAHRGVKWHWKRGLVQ